MSGKAAAEKSAPQKSESSSKGGGWNDRFAYGGEIKQAPLPKAPFPSIHEIKANKRLSSNQPPIRKKGSGHAAKNMSTQTEPNETESMIPALDGPTIVGDGIGIAMIQAESPGGIDMITAGRKSVASLPTCRLSSLKIEVTESIQVGHDDNQSMRQSKKDVVEMEGMIDRGLDGNINTAYPLCRLEILGRGSSASVYKAVLLNSLTLCAEKVVVVADYSKRAQLLRELQSLKKTLVDREGRTKCTNIVSLLDIVPNPRDGTLSICLEYMDGGSLQDLVKTGLRQTEKVVQGIAQQMLIGLSFLHSLRLIHRDVKPSNALISSTGIVKLADFGLARTLESGASLAESFCGTFDYMAPERMIGNSYSFHSDVWSLGLTVHTVAIGTYPYAVEKGGFWAILNAVQEQPIPLPSVHEYSSSFADFISKACARDPTDRPTAQQLLSHPFILSSPPGPINTNDIVRKVIHPSSQKGQQQGVSAPPVDMTKGIASAANKRTNKGGREVMVPPSSGSRIPRGVDSRPIGPLHNRPMVRVSRSGDAKASGSDRSRSRSISVNGRRQKTAPAAPSSSSASSVVVSSRPSQRHPHHRTSRSRSRSQSVTRGEEAPPSDKDGVRGRQRQGLGEGLGSGSRQGRSRSTSRQSRGSGPGTTSGQRQGRSRSRSMSNQSRHQSHPYRRHGGPSSRDNDNDTSVNRDRHGSEIKQGKGKGGGIPSAVAGGGGVESGKDKKPMIDAVSDGKKTNYDNNNHNNNDDRHMERGRGRERERRPPTTDDGMMIRKPPLPSAGRGNGSGSRNRSKNGNDHGSRNGSDSGNGSVNRHPSREEDRTRSRSVSQSRVSAPGQGLGRRDRSNSRNRTSIGAHNNKSRHSRNSIETKTRKKNESDTSDDERIHGHPTEQRKGSGVGLGSHPAIHPSSHVGKGGVGTQAQQPNGGNNSITTTDAARIAQAWRDYATLLSATSVVSGAGISTIKEELSPSILSPSSLHHRPFSGVIPMNAVGTGSLPTITTETIDALAKQLGGKDGMGREEETSILRRAFFTAVNEMKQVVSKAVMCETCEEDTPVKSPVKPIRSQSNLPVKQLASSIDTNNDTLYASDFECEDPHERYHDSDDEHVVDEEVVEDMMTSGKGKDHHMGNKGGNVFKLTTELSEQESDEIAEEPPPPQLQQQQQRMNETERSVPEGNDIDHVNDNDDDDDEEVEEEEASQAHTGRTSVMNSRSGSVSRIPSMLSAASALDTERRPLSRSTMLSSVSDLNVDKDKENYRNCITPSPLLFMGEPLPAPLEEDDDEEDYSKYRSSSSQISNKNDGNNSLRSSQNSIAPVATASAAASVTSPRRSSASVIQQQPSKSPKHAAGKASGNGNTNGPLMIGATVGSLIDSQKGSQKGSHISTVRSGPTQTSGLSKVTKGIAIKPVPSIQSSTSKPSTTKQSIDTHNSNNKTQPKTATNRSSLASLQSNYLNLNHMQGSFRSIAIDSENEYGSDFELED